jgi:AraC-like DNA-binding protein
LKKAQECARLKFLGYELQKSQFEIASETQIDSFKKPWKPIDVSTLKVKTEYPVEDLAQELQWSVRYLQRIVEQKTGIHNAITLTKKQYAKCAEAINSRKNALARQAKAERFALESSPKKYSYLSNNSKGNKSSEESSGPWGEVAKYGPGKLIYIRSR